MRHLIVAVAKLAGRVAVFLFVAAAITLMTITWLAGDRTWPWDPTTPTTLAP